MPSYKYLHRFARLLPLIAIVCIGFYPEVGHAEEVMVGVQKTISTVVPMMIEVINLVVWILFAFLNFVLDPRFIFDLSDNGQSGAFMDMLNEIWQLSRNLMNMIFATILLGAAVYTIVTAKKDFVAEYAPKFLIAIVLVNFSWFFPRVIIDVANVVTSTIYHIPSMLPTGQNALCEYPSSVNGPTCRANGDSFLCKCEAVVDMEMFLSKEDYADLTSFATAWSCPLGPLLCIQKEELSMSTMAGQSVILNGLIVNHARLASLSQVANPTGGDDQTLKMVMFIMREMLILIIHIAMVFPLLAMFTAFLIRIPILWITIAFMPFIFLNMVAPEQLHQGYPKKLWEHFLKAAFLPALVAIPLTVGFILINAGSKLKDNPLANIEIRLLDQVDDLWQLLWLCMSLCVIWVGVFTVLESAGIMGKAAGTIKGYGEKLGTAAAKVPLSLPTVGLPGGHTPLSFLKAVHPDHLNYLLSQPGGAANLKHALDTGTGDDFRRDKAAKKLSNDKDRLGALNTKLEALRADPSKAREIAAEIKREHDIEINESNIHSVMEDVHRRTQVHGGDADQLAKMKDHLDRIRANAARRAPPAA